MDKDGDDIGRTEFLGTWFINMVDVHYRRPGAFSGIVDAVRLLCETPPLVMGSGSGFDEGDDNDDLAADDTNQLVQQVTLLRAAEKQTVGFVLWFVVLDTVEGRHHTGNSYIVVEVCPAHLGWWNCRCTKCRAWEKPVLRCVEKEKCKFVIACQRWLRTKGRVHALENDVVTLRQTAYHGRKPCTPVFAVWAQCSGESKFGIVSMEWKHKPVWLCHGYSHNRSQSTWRDCAHTRFAEENLVLQYTRFSQDTLTYLVQNPVRDIYTVLNDCGRSRRYMFRW